MGGACQVKIKGQRWELTMSGKKLVSVFRLLFFLVKRPILSVGWNLSGFCPCFQPLLGAVACHSPARRHLSQLFCSAARPAAAADVGHGERQRCVWRSRPASVLGVKVRAGREREVPVSSLIRPDVMNGPCRPLPPSLPHSLARPLCSDTVVKCNLGDRG